MIHGSWWVSEWYYIFFNSVWLKVDYLSKTKKNRTQDPSMKNRWSNKAPGSNKTKTLGQIHIPKYDLSKCTHFKSFTTPKTPGIILHP